MYALDDRLEFLQTICKIAVRPLIATRTPEMLDALYMYTNLALHNIFSCLHITTRFIDEVSGRPFQRNRLSMVRVLLCPLPR